MIDIDKSSPYISPEVVILTKEEYERVIDRAYNLGYLDAVAKNTLKEVENA